MALNLPNPSLLHFEIPVMNLIDELRNDVTWIKCEMIEDNTAARTITIVPKYRPRTAQINNKHFHLIEHIEKGGDK